MSAGNSPRTESNIFMHVQDGITCVQFTSTKIVDVKTISQLGDELLALVEKRAIRKMVIDMQSVQFLSSAMLGKLMAVHKSLAANKGALKISGLAPSLLEVFKITRLDKIFQIYPTVSEAITSFRPGS